MTRPCTPSPLIGSGQETLIPATAQAYIVLPPSSTHGFFSPVNQRGRWQNPRNVVHYHRDVGVVRPYRDRGSSTIVRRHMKGQSVP
jgi:hypothetical protein